MFYKVKSLETLTEIVDGITYIERWLPITYFYGVYEISDFGRVKSLPRVMNVCGVKRFCNVEKMLSQGLTGKGYLSVTLRSNGICKSLVVHRIVGKAFIPNPDNLPEINHLKGIKIDNRYHQLEWSTHKDNCDHAVRLGLTFISSKCKKAVAEKNKLYCGVKHYMSKPVLNTETGICYNSASEAAKSVPMPASTLYERINGRRPNNTKFIYACEED